MCDKTSCFRVVVLVWASIWMLMVPLVHVHPEVEHNHGDLGHVHYAVTHTVFSAPLECEHSTELHDETCPTGIHQHAPSIGHHGHTVTHPEIEYTFIASSTTPTIGKILLSPSILIEDVPSPAPVVISETTSAPDVPPPILFLSTALPLRAPPTPLS